MGSSEVWVGSMVRASSMGLNQKDNGVCLLTEDGIAFAVSEERLSRKKHDSDYQLSMEAASRYVETHKLQPVGAALTSCGDLPGSMDSLPSWCVRPIPVPSHHYAHALSAYWMSDFDSALVLVMDAGGSILSQPEVPGHWWSARREQTSFWVGSGEQVSLRRYIQADPFDIGFGEWWRAFTYFLGWHTHTLTGNTMALAALGDDRYLGAPPLWADLSGTFDGRVRNDPRHPVSMVRAALVAAGIEDAPPPRSPGSPIESGHAALARYLQVSFTSALQCLIREEMSASNAVRVCMSGGVAQNCVAAGVIGAEVGAGNLFVPVTAGDVGQPVGAALHAAQSLGARWPRREERIFLGPAHDVFGTGPDHFTAMKAAELIAAGGIVAVAQGRSEFGPRALGHRSVLCDPLDRTAVARVKAGVKMRDDFMPLAPAVRSDVLQPWPQLSRSRTMTIAPLIPSAATAEFGEAIHADGTARIQVVEPGEVISAVIDAFEKLTGRRVLINTSFNRRGEPIAESPDDAYGAFQSLDLDGLLIGASLIKR